MGEWAERCRGGGSSSAYPVILVGYRFKSEPGLREVRFLKFHFLIWRRSLESVTSRDRKHMMALIWANSFSSQKRDPSMAVNLLHRLHIEAHIAPASVFLVVNSTQYGGIRSMHAMTGGRV